MALSPEEDARIGVTQLLHAYCEIVDAGTKNNDWQTYGAKWCALFAKEGVMNPGKPFTPNKHGPKVQKGLVEYFKATSHQITNINIMLDPTEKDTAWSECKVYAWHRPRKDTNDTGETDWEIWATYKDKCVKEDGEWRFAYRWAKGAGERGPGMTLGGGGEKPPVKQRASDGPKKQPTPPIDFPLMIRNRSRI